MREIGINDGAFAVKGTGARTIVHLSVDGQKGLRLLPEASHRLYLCLEEVRGTRDATVLNVYLFGMPDEPLSRLAGSAGLFGLRMASLPGGENEGTGLTFTFDVTDFLKEPEERTDIPVGIAPVRQLPETSDISIGKVFLFLEP